MTGRGSIEAYLRELRRELTGPARLRERVVAEAADHLRLSAEHIDPAGAGSSDAAQRAATARFGPPRQVAHRFAQELAADDAHRVTRVVSLTTIAFGILFGVSGPARSAAAVWAPFAVQLAFVCSALSFVRCLRHRHERTVSAAKLRWILRGNEVALGVIVVSIGTEAVGIAAGHTARAWHVSTVVLSIAMGALAVLALGRVLAGQARLRSLEGFEDGDDREGPEEIAAALEHAARSVRLPGEVTRWLNLRSHPWRVGIVVALTAGACAGGGHALLEHPGSLSQIPGAIAAFTVIAGIEAVAVLVCFGLLGRFLGLRRPRRLSATRR